MSKQQPQDHLSELAASFGAPEEGAAPTAPAAAAAPPPAAPAPSGTDEALSNLGGGGMITSLFNTIRETPAAIWNGVAKAANEPAKITNHVEDWIAEKTGLRAGYLQFGGNPDGSFIDWHQKARADSELSTIPEADAPKTTLGGMIQSATQLGVGIVGVGKVFKAAGVVGPASKMGKVAFSGLKTAIADPLVMDAYTERLSNIVEDVPYIGKPVKKYLAADPSDPLALAKLKQGLEGFVVGLPLEALMGTAALIKKSRLFTTPGGKAAAGAEDELVAALTSVDAQLNSAEKNARWLIQDVDESGAFKIVDKRTGDVHPVTFTTRQAAEAEGGMLNTMEIEQLRMNPVGHPFTKEQVEAYRATAGKLDGSEEFAQMLEEGGTDFNFRRIHGAEDAKLQLETLAKVEREAIDAARGGAQVTHEETINMARDLFPGEDPTQIISDLSRVYNNTQDLAAHLLAGKKLMILQGRAVGQMVQLADAAPESALASLRLWDSLDQFLTTTVQVKSVITNAARATEIGKVDAVEALITGAEKLPNMADKATSVLQEQLAGSGPTSVAARKLLASVHGMSFEEMRVMARRILYADGDPSAILAAVQSVRTNVQKGGTAFGSEAVGKTVKTFNEYWINSLLSGTKTWAVNTTSNAAYAFIKPVETFNSGVYQIWKGEIGAGKKAMSEGMDLIWGNVKAVKESLSLAKKSFMVGESLLDPGSIAKSEGAQHMIGGDIGTLVRMPSRMLMASDEFYKQMAYRANIRAAALREARETGVQDIEGFLSKKMEAAFMNDRGINKAGINYARDITYTKSLESTPGGDGLYAPLAAKLQGISNEHPLAKVVLPFIQTPTNILHWTWERTPLLRMANRTVRDDLAAGGARAAMAQAKMGTGMALWTLAGGLAASGLITGRGPSNAALRDQWLETHQPYSINIGGKWYEYKRADPVTAPIGFAADFMGIVADMVHASGEVQETETKDIALAAATAVANSFTSKTYLTGIINAMDAFTSNSTHRMDNFLKQEAGTLIPNVLNQNNPDDTMREVRSYVDAMLNRMPGFSEKLPPRANLFGEPVLKAPGWANRAFNPFTMSGKTDGVLEQKLLALGKAMPMPSPDHDGIRFDNDKYGLTKEGLTPYDRMLQLVAQPKGGPSLREELNIVTNSEGWNSLPDSAGVKYDMISTRVQKHRQAAFEVIKREFPALGLEFAQKAVTNRAQKVQGDAGVQRLQDLFKTK